MLIDNSVAQNFIILIPLSCSTRTMLKMMSPLLVRIGALLMSAELTYAFTAYQQHSPFPSEGIDYASTPPLCGMLDTMGTLRRRLDQHLGSSHSLSTLAAISRREFLPTFALKEGL